MREVKVHAGVAEAWLLPIGAITAPFAPHTARLYGFSPGGMGRAFHSCPLGPLEPLNPGKNFRGDRPPTPESGRWWHGPLRVSSATLSWNPSLGHAMATLLESACLIVRSQPSSRDGRYHAFAEDSVNGHLRKGRSPRMVLAG